VINHLDGLDVDTFLYYAVFLKYIYFFTVCFELFKYYIMTTYFFFYILKVIKSLIKLYVKFMIYFILRNIR